MDLANFSALDSLGGLGVRDLIILAIGVIAVYLLVSLLRLSQTRSGSKPAKWSGFLRAAPGSARRAAASSAAASSGRGRGASALDARQRTREPGLAGAGQEGRPERRLPTDPWADTQEPGAAAFSPASLIDEGTVVDNLDSSTPGVPLFEFQLYRNQMEAELQLLRQALAELQENVAQLSLSRRISPQYNEAMQLAQHGASAQMIADQCAISLGEAELVAALGRDANDMSGDNASAAAHINDIWGEQDTLPRQQARPQSSADQAPHFAQRARQQVAAAYFADQDESAYQPTQEYAHHAQRQPY